MVSLSVVLLMQPIGDVAIASGFIHEEVEVLLEEDLVDTKKILQVRMKTKKILKS